jgi:two-component system NtrC family sensor kinase
MNPAWYFGSPVSALAVLWLTARETNALIMAVVSLLFFRAFRERYLLTWGLGWMAYCIFLWVERGTELHGASTATVAFGQAEFALALGLFAAAVLISTQARRMLTALVMACMVAVTFAAMRPIYFPESVGATWALEVAYRLIALATVIQLWRHRWGKIGVGGVLVSAGLLTVNFHWPSLTSRIPGDVWLLAEVLFGSSIFLLALADQRTRMHRLAMLNELTVAISRAQHSGPLLQATLEKLKSSTKARATWVRLLDGQRMMLAQHVGVSPDFVKAIGQVAMDDTMARVLEGTKAVILKPADIPAPVLEQLQKDGIRHLIVVPVQGKKSVIGTLCLGWAGTRPHTTEELEFLETIAQQLGIAVENVRLLEQVLRSQRQWMNTFDSIQDLILAHDADFRILKTNQALLQRLDKAPADVVGQTCEAMLPKQLPWTGCPYCERGSGLVEGPDLCFGGQSLVSTSLFTEQGTQQKGTIHVVRDTTDRHVAEEKYRMLFEQAQEGVFVANLDGKLLDCNDAFVTMLGYTSREELMALDIDSVVYPVADERDAFRKEIEAHNYVRNFEITVRRKDGTLLTAAESCFATRDIAGNIERYQGFVLDITEKKRSEDEMRRRNRELNALNAMAVIATQSFDLDEILNLTVRQVISLFNAETGSVYLCTSQDGIFRRRAGWGPRSEARMKLSEVTFPEGFGDLVMRSRAEVVTQDFVPHLPPAMVEFACADRLPCWIWVLLWSKDRPIGMMGIACKEKRQYSANDENLLVAISRQLATTIEKVQLYEETCRAYEDLRRTQEQLLQSEKMSAVGQLIAGVAHELNNPLTAILGYAQLLEQAGLDHRSADFVKKLFKQAQRTHRVVQNLLSFARQRKPQKQEVDLARVLEETLTLREYDLKVNNITLERDIPADLPAVMGDPHQLEQVFLNIINNALDAMLEGSGSGVLKVRVFRKENQVCTEFDDSGPGIKDTTRIFDPFYTTKSVGKGTGLGLSICYGIIKEHGGDIVARNRSEGGATIEVRLPAAGQQASAAEATAAPSRREALLEGRVLLVEDEEAVLEFERDVLIGAGAEVTTAMSTDATREHLQSGKFDAVVLNGRMPGGANAIEMYRWIASQAFGMEKKLMMTFSTVADPETRRFLQENGVPILSKPFEVADLISQVRKLLHKTEAQKEGGSESESKPAQPESSSDEKAAAAGSGS